MVRVLTASVQQCRHSQAAFRSRGNKEGGLGSSAAPTEDWAQTLRPGGLPTLVAGCS